MMPSQISATKRISLLAALCLGGLAALLPTTSALAQTNYEPYAFTTYAGVSKGAADGTGSAARFQIPSGTAVDSAGNVYVADTNNHTIRKITSSGVVTTLAGTPGVFGFNDGTGAAAQFYFPQDVAVDGSGNVYVADTGNDTIRKITPGGVVSTFAGTATVVGSKDGTGTAALFNGPYSVAVDGSGNVIVADTGNFTIRKITPAGVVSTYAGAVGILGSSNGTGTAANFGSPSGVAVDGSGNIYVADSTNNEIRKVAAGGVVTTLAGVATKNGSGHSDGTGQTAQFNNPFGVACDSAGNIYVADTNNNIIRKITSGGTVTTLAGTASIIGSADASGSAASSWPTPTTAPSARSPRAAPSRPSPVSRAPGATTGPEPRRASGTRSRSRLTARGTCTWRTSTTARSARSPRAPW
jgi:sugar lactone lactonase YvrE